MMQASGMIENAFVSFSIATSDMDDQSYAIFGDYNPDQIVGGNQGLIEFPNFDNELETWAIAGQGLYYNDQLLQREESDMPAIIDTGSTLLSLPP